MSTTDMLVKILPIIISIALGYILAQTNILNNNMADAFKKIIVNVTLPAGLFSAFLGIRFKAGYLLIIVSIFISCFLLFFIAKLIARLLSIKSKYFPFLLTAFEAGMIGYALFTAVYGPESAADFGIIDIGHVTFVFFVFVPMLINLDSKEKGWASIKKSLKTAVKSPVIWAILLGVTGSILGLSVYKETVIYSAIMNIFAFAYTPTTFLICLVIGSGLKISIKSVKTELFTAVLKVILGLLFALLLKYVVFVPLEVDKRFITALFVLSTLPAPFVIPVFMKNPSIEDINYVSNTLSIGSILAVLCFAAIMLLGL